MRFFVFYVPRIIQRQTMTSDNECYLYFKQTRTFKLTRHLKSARAALLDQRVLFWDISVWSCRSINFYSRLAFYSLLRAALSKVCSQEPRSLSSCQNTVIQQLWIKLIYKNSTQHVYFIRHFSWFFTTQLLVIDFKFLLNRVKVCDIPFQLRLTSQNFSPFMFKIVWRHFLNIWVNEKSSEISSQYQ